MAMTPSKTGGGSHAGPIADKRLTEYWDWMLASLDAGLGSRLSAQHLVPLVAELLRPRSVIDVGCGSGSWLVAFQAAGVEDILGVDGPHLDKRHLLIDEGRFVAADLQNSFELGRKFDLALCLEVAGYMTPEASENLIRTLTDAAPAILFSAPIPHQDHDTVQPNQHWPEHWAEMFSKRGFVALDCIRKSTWNNDEISWWYRQNMVLYVRRDHLDSNEALKLLWERDPAPPMPLVHPQHYSAVHAGLRKSLLRRALSASKSPLGRALPTGVKSTLRKPKNLWRPRS